MAAPEGIEFAHVFYPGHGGFTVAYRREGDTLVTGFAAIAPNEKRIIRRRGCTIAIGRMMKRPVRIQCRDGENPKRIIARALASNHIMPETKTHACADDPCPLWWRDFARFLQTRKEIVG